MSTRSSVEVVRSARRAERRLLLFTAHSAEEVLRCFLSYNWKSTIERLLPPGPRLSLCHLSLIIAPSALKLLPLSTCAFINENTLSSERHFHTGPHKQHLLTRARDGNVCVTLVFMLVTLQRTLNRLCNSLNIILMLIKEDHQREDFYT